MSLTALAPLSESLSQLSVDNIARNHAVQSTVDFCDRIPSSAAEDIAVSSVRATLYPATEPTIAALRRDPTVTSIRQNNPYSASVIGTVSPQLDFSLLYTYYNSLMAQQPCPETEPESLPLSRRMSFNNLCGGGSPSGGSPTMTGADFPVPDCATDGGVNSSLESIGYTQSYTNSFSGTPTKEFFTARTLYGGSPTMEPPAPASGRMGRVYRNGRPVPVRMPTAASSFTFTAYSSAIPTEDA